MITIPNPAWSFLDKWFTYDKEHGEPSNMVVCPNCAPRLENDPTARPLQDQTPDSRLWCEYCEKPWVNEPLEE